MIIVLTRHPSSLPLANILWMWMGFSKVINKSMTIGKANGHFDSVRNQSLDQANEGFWALGPVLKCRFYIQVWSGQQIRRKLPLKIVCCSQFPGEGNMPHTQGHRQNQQGQSRGKGVNLRNKHSLSISLSHLCTYRPNFFLKYFKGIWRYIHLPLNASEYIS